MHHLSLLTIVILTIAGCSTAPTQEARVPLTPIPQGPTDPGDHVVKASIENFLRNSEAPTFSQYEFSRVDLDADGRRDALVLFKNPYGYWCGMHGCTMLVLKAHNDHFTLVNAIQPVREPLYISEDKTNGWKNLITRVSGRWNTAKNVEMTFNGAQYPVNPSNLPAQTQEFAFLAATPVFVE